MRGCGKKIRWYIVVNLGRWYTHVAVVGPADRLAVFVQLGDGDHLQLALFTVIASRAHCDLQHDGSGNLVLVDRGQLLRLQLLLRR